jgi:protein O-GlcNAc transferase
MAKKPEADKAPSIGSIPGVLAQAVDFHQAGQLLQAEQIYRKVIHADPKNADAWHLLGVIGAQVNDHEVAVQYILRAIELNPNATAFHANLGAAYQKLRQFDKAITCYRRALELNPNNAEAHNNLGVAFQSQGELATAEACFRRALVHNPAYTEAQRNLANVRLALDKQAEAVSVQPKSDNADAYNNLGNVLKDAAQVSAAITYYRRALQLNPELAEAHNNLGNALKDQGKIEEALPCYRRALELRPDLADVHSNLIFSLQYRADISLAELAAAHAEYDRRHAAPLKSQWPAAQAHREFPRRLRLGFLSPDFCQHPVGFFLIRTLENLDRREVEVVCYNDRGSKDCLTSRFEAAASLWRDVSGWDDQRLADRIRDDKIHILFDLAGHTAHNRMLMFARKPAPIQITWIGNEGTTGLSAMDYLLADRHMVPETAERYYREKILRLPDSYVCFDPPEDSPAVSELPALRAGFVTFGSCNNLAKINAQVAATWAEILRRVPAARLLLKYRGLEDDGLRAYYLDFFAAHGIPSERLELEGWSPLAEMLAGHDRIDMALDPFPFAGGVTTCNTLWMGVPVVTWPGETFASRHSLSYLSAVGLTEMVAGSRDEYVQIATNLANDLPRLAAIRAGLRQHVASSPLCDGKRLARHLMSLLRGVARQ